MYVLPQSSPGKGCAFWAKRYVSDRLSPLRRGTRSLGQYDKFTSVLVLGPGHGNAGQRAVARAYVSREMLSFSSRSALGTFSEYSAMLPRGMAPS